MMCVYENTIENMAALHFNNGELYREVMPLASICQIIKSFYKFQGPNFVRKCIPP